MFNLLRAGQPLKSRMIALLLTAAVTVPVSAQAQTSAINPFTYTCGDLLAAADQGPGHSDTRLANLMILWTAGYLYGRLDSIETSNFNNENFDLVRDDTVAALTSICPNIPDMPIADFASNLADDIERSLAGD